MLVPDGLKPDRKAPLLVYFYETWSSMLHTHYNPGPGTSPNLTRYVSNGYVVLLPDVHYKVGPPRQERGERAAAGGRRGAEDRLRRTRSGWASPATRGRPTRSTT